MQSALHHPYKIGMQINSIIPSQTKEEQIEVKKQAPKIVPHPGIQRFIKNTVKATQQLAGFK